MCSTNLQKKIARQKRKASIAVISLSSHALSGILGESFGIVTKFLNMYVAVGADFAVMES